MNLVFLYVVAYVGAGLCPGFLSPIAAWLIEGGL